MSEKSDKASGKVKQAAGDLTGNDDLEREGQAEETSGDVKGKVSDAADKVKDTAGDAVDGVKNTFKN